MAKKIIIKLILLNKFNKIFYQKCIFFLINFTLIVPICIGIYRVPYLKSKTEICQSICQKIKIYRYFIEEK